MATEHDLYKIIGDIDVCTEFEMLQVKVPISFLGTVGFSLRREGRYEDSHKYNSHVHSFGEDKGTKKTDIIITQYSRRNTYWKRMDT